MMISEIQICIQTSCGRNGPLGVDDWFPTWMTKVQFPYRLCCVKYIYQNAPKKRGIHGRIHPKLQNKTPHN